MPFLGTIFVPDTCSLEMVRQNNRGCFEVCIFWAFLQEWSRCLEFSQISWLWPHSWLLSQSESSWCLMMRKVSMFFFLRSIQNFVEVFNPSCCLFTLSHYSNFLLTPCCSKFILHCYSVVLLQKDLVISGALFHLSVLFWYSFWTLFYNLGDPMFSILDFRCSNLFP